MSDNGAKAPTERTTRPLGNSAPPPTPLARGIGPNAAEKLRHDHPDAHRRVQEHLTKKKTQSGHATR